MSTIGKRIPGTHLYLAKDGNKCYKHYFKLGVPQFHTVGCVACEADRAKGIVRPDYSKGGRVRVGQAEFTRVAQRLRRESAARAQYYREHVMNKSDYGE